MNLNKTTAYIGDSTSFQGELARIIKEIPEEKDKDQFVVFLTFNLKEQQIYFSSGYAYHRVPIDKGRASHGIQ